MPELPEVHTIVDDLKESIRGETITDFWSDWAKSVKGNINNFKREVILKKIIDVSRYGKDIFMAISDNKTIIIHLRMTGALIAKRIMNNAKRDRYVHHIFFLKSGRCLEFSDVRKFGSLEIINSSDVRKYLEKKRIGTDALSEKLTLPEFNKILKKSKLNIKQIIMNQEKISGIGNIYASEILHFAGISPKRRAQSLSEREVKALLLAIKKVLKKAIKMRGTSISDYRDASGKKGKFQNHLQVYKRAGKKCKRCGNMIERFVLGQRSTFHCPACQK